MLYWGSIFFFYIVNDSKYECLHTDITIEKVILKVRSLASGRVKVKLKIKKFHSVITDSRQVIPGPLMTE